MTQLHFTLNTEDIQNLINSEVKNDMANAILTKVFNELMEKERDEYLEIKLIKEILVELPTVMDTMNVNIQQI